jgi:hypothetical protein
MKITIELTEDDMFDIICAFDGAEVLLKQNARETDLKRMKKLFLEGAEKARANKYKWIAIRNAMFK